MRARDASLSSRRRGLSTPHFTSHATHGTRRAFGFFFGVFVERRRRRRPLTDTFLFTTPARDDSDDVIEQVTKMSVSEIFAAEGEEGFRDVETQILAELAAYKKCVVATGGGIVKKKGNWMHLRNGVVVCLSGTPELLASRVTRDGAESRPLFADANGDEAKIAAIIGDLQAERAEMYANADVAVKLLVGEDGGEGGPPAVDGRRRLARPPFSPGGADRRDRDPVGESRVHVPRRRARGGFERDARRASDRSMA